MSMRRLPCVLAVFASALVLDTSAAIAEPDLRGYEVDQLIDSAFVERTRDWLEVPVTRLSVTSQNERLGDMTTAAIEELDQQWRAEREREDQPLITSVLAGPLSSYLTRIQAGALGLYSEIFVTDNKGLNVGQSAITSDYWQGDEAKFQKTYPEGRNAIFVSEPEFFENSGTWHAQLNMTVHGQDGAAIGAATVEVNLTELARRRAAADQ